MFRFIAPLAVLVGVFAGLIGPASAHETGATLSVGLTPPTLSSGSSPLLTCGWHTACVSPYTASYGLDWDDNSTGYGNAWYFRGFFYVSDSSRTAFKMYPLVSQQGSSICDVMTVWITEIHSGALMAIPTYTHVDITASSAFSWSGSQWTTYQSKQIGTTIDDTGASCAFGGSHVHESHVDYLTSDVTISRHTSYYPTASSCHTTCGTHQNNNIDKWTRSWEWEEGVVSH